MTRRPSARHRPARVLVCLALTTVLVAGCGGDGADDGGGDGNGGTTDPTGVCDDVKDVQASVTALTDVTLDKSTIATLQDDLDTVRADVSTLISDAQDEYADEVDAVDQAVSGLTTSLRKAAESPSATTLAGVRTATQQLTTTVGDLTDAVQGSC